MTKRIFRGIAWAVTITVLLTSILLTVISYHTYENTLKEALRTEAGHICYGLEQASEPIAYLSDVKTNDRVTLVAADGTVLYDNRTEAAAMENHRARPEIRDALETGQGTAHRYSDTLAEVTYYHAVLMADGNVLRISDTQSTLLALFARTLPLSAAILAAVLLGAFLVARWQAKRIVTPINDLDLEHPLRNETYEELSPLLERMEVQQQAMKAAENSRREFTANVSHELKTPLTSISGFAEIMRDGVAQAEDMQRFAGKIYDEAQRLIALVNDILSLSALDEGRGIEPEKEVELRTLCEQIVELLTPLAAQKGVAVTVQGGPQRLWGHPMLLNEMVYNLVDNGIKYTDPNGTVTVLIGQEDGHPALTVQDDGIGIPKEHQARIFERFYRVDKSHSRATGGTGLGLSIVKHGAGVHRADLRLVSEEGKGTTVRLIFPNDRQK